MIGRLSISPWGKTAQSPLVWAYDCFPFGMLMPGRFISDTSDHCMTISRSNWSTEMADTCKPLVTLASTGVFSAGSSISTSGSNIKMSAPEEGNWIQLTTEVEAGIDNSFTFDVPVLEGAGKSGMQVMIIETRDNTPYVIGGGYLIPGGRKQTISFNASGNTVNLLFNGPFSTAEIEQICTHYTKTTQQSYLVEVCDDAKDKYRFGFNGQEKDNEIAGVGNHNTALFWEYDTRLGRRWNLDPKPIYGISSYSVFKNNSIFNTDALGDTTVAYSTKGDYIGTINDQLPNQIHFIELKHSKLDQAKTLLGKINNMTDKDERNAWSFGIRKYSTAYIGENSAKSLESIAIESAKMDEGIGREEGFFSKIGSSRELSFEKLPPPLKGRKVGKWDEDSYPADALRNPNVGNNPSPLIVGHTHVRYWFKVRSTTEGGFPGVSNIPLIKQNRQNTFETLARPSGRYYNGINGDMDVTRKDQPHIIASPLGVTIFQGGSGTYKKFKHEWFKR